MIKLIIGQNAIGKSVYIKNAANEALKKEDSVLSNIWNSKYLKNRAYNDERIEVLYDILDAEEVIENTECLAVKGGQIMVGQNFANILTLICKCGDYLYLDEPEYGLNNHEIGYLVAFLYKILDTFKLIEIVTHSELFFGIQEAEMRTVTLNSRKQYILSELGEDAYVTID